MRDRWDKILSTLLTAAGLAIAVVLVHREFFADASPRQRPTKPQYVSTWREILPVGRILGDTSAPVKVIEFADLQCPFCRTFNNTIQEVRKVNPNDVAFVFVHLPLAMHRFARPAARAAECAHTVGRFEQLVNLIYDKQDSLGLKSWSSYARDAGIQDSVRFLNCVSDTTTLVMVESGVAAARKLNITGTPTILVNGWRLEAPPSTAGLLQAVNEIRAGKEPRWQD